MKVYGMPERVEYLNAALTEITKRQGRYSRDPFEHAMNTIDAMSDIAQGALDGTWREKETD